MNLQFVNQLLLWGGLAALLPVIIHLVQRRRIQRVVFGSVRFLRKMSHRVVQRRRLAEVLLIVLRCLAVGAIALAFARPFFARPDQQAQAAGTAGQGGEATLLLVDNSYSMQAGSRRSAARQAALDQIKNAPAGSVFGVASFSSGLEVLAPVGSSADDASAAVKKIEPSFRGTHLDGALREAVRLLEGQSGKKKIVLISDMPKSGWLNRDWKLKADIDFDVCDVSGQAVPNVAVERVAVPRLVLSGLGFPEVVWAKVSNYTPNDITNAEVLFKIGEQTEKRTISIRANSFTPVTFRHNFVNSGDTAGSVSVSAADKLTDDNTGCFSVHAAPRIRVLLVDGGAARGDSGFNSAFFLRTALAPSQTSPFIVKQAAANALTAKDLEGIDVVVMADVDEVAGEFLPALSAFVTNRGKGVAFFCGEGVNADKFNHSFGPIAPCKLGQYARPLSEPPGRTWNIAWVRGDHEIFQPFSQPHSGDFGIVTFNQYFRLHETQGSAILAKFNSDELALLERQFRGEGGKLQGRSILFASGADMRWSDFCVRVLFSPFVHQVAKRLCTEEAAVRNVLVGETIALSLAPGATAAQLTDPAGRTSSLAVGRNADDQPMATFVPERPGVYEVRSEQDVARFAVNIDPAEADPTKLDVEYFKTVLKPDPAASVETAGAAPTALTRSAEQIESQQRWWFWLAVLAATALVGEMILADRTGTA